MPKTPHKNTPEIWLRQQANTAKGRLLAAVIFTFVAGLLIIIQARLLAYICHQVVMEQQGLATVLPFLGWILLVLLLRAACTFWGENAAILAAAEVKQRVRTALYRHILCLKPGGTAGDTGHLTEVVSSAVEGLDTYLSRFLPQLLLAALLPLALLLVVLPVEWRAALVLIFSAPFIPLLMVLIGKGSERLNQRQFTLLSRLSGYLLDLIQGLPDLKIFGVAKQEAEFLRQSSEQYRTATMSVLRVAFLSAFALEFFSTVGTAVIAVVIGFRLLAGEILLLDGLFVLILAPEFYLPLRNLGLAYHSRMNGLAAAGQIIPLLHDESSAQNRESDCNSESQSIAAPVQSDQSAPEITCQSVSFRYGDKRGGVQNISLTIPTGSITALVGASGSGKSTLARLLLGLSRPESGRIMVNGADLAGLDYQQWQQRLAWVPQQPFFFADSIRSNLLLGCPEASQSEQVAALQQVGLWETISALPDKLDTMLGEQGAGLSGGELKRLAFARVLLRKAVLVVLDEPTAGLDADSEQLLLDSINRLASGRTILVVSHREATIACAEQVAELADGRLLRVCNRSEWLEGRP